MYVPLAFSSWPTTYMYFYYGYYVNHQWTTMYTHFYTTKKSYDLDMRSSMRLGYIKSYSLISYR
jgi:hypothetical protein